MKHYKSASIDVTYHCNLRCRHCYNYSNGRPSRAEMTTSELLSIAGDLAKLHLESICLCGGEPLCRLEDVTKIAACINYIDSANTVSMVTNGHLWTPKVANKLREAGISFVQFSLDGFSNESYDYVRQSNGSLHKVFDAVKMAQDAGLKVMISALPHQKSIGEFEDIIQYCMDNKIEELRVQPLMPLGRGKENYGSLCLSDAQTTHLRELLSEQNNRIKQMTIEWGDPIDHFFMLQEVEFLPLFSITAYGELMLSPYLPISIWNCRSATISDYLKKRIDEKVVHHPLVVSTLEDIVTLADLAKEHKDLPILYLDENLDISAELEEMETKYV